MANSFSNIFFPGSRLGCVAAGPEIVHQLYNAHSAATFHTGMISQVSAAEFFNRGYFQDHPKRICGIWHLQGTPGRDGVNANQKK